MKMNTLKYIVASTLLASSLSSCYNPNQRAENADDVSTTPGVEYAPQMYHSEAYDPMTQVDDRSAGLNYWPFKEVGTGHGEFYNSNDYNPHSMNMRVPAANTVRRADTPYMLPKDSLDKASSLVSPLVIDMEKYVTEAGDTSMRVSALGTAQLEDCKNLYLRFCSHCHGKDGQADGKVAEKFGGVPPYNGAAIKDKPVGHIFHVITYGKGRMGAHGSQLSQEERWKIATYVQTLQKK